LNLQKFEKENFAHFVSHPLRENYPKTSFVKVGASTSRKLTKWKTVLSPTFSNHVFESVVASIENSFIALYRAATSAPGLPARITKQNKYCSQLQLNISI